MRLAEIQAALREEGLDGWLFFDHHRRDPLAYRVLQFTPGSMVTRRWYYFVPASGEPRGLVHRIEAQTLGGAAGTARTVLGLGRDGRADCGACSAARRRVAMQYSPNCAVPYVAMVDAGTVELVRGLGVEVVTSANLIQFFESRGRESSSRVIWRPDAGSTGFGARRSTRIGAKLRAGERVTEWEMQQFILARFREDGLFTDHGPDVAVNANASNPHYDPKQDACSEIKHGRPGADRHVGEAGSAGERLLRHYVGWILRRRLAGGDREGVRRGARGARSGDRSACRMRWPRKQELRGFEVDDAARGLHSRAGIRRIFFSSHGPFHRDRSSWHGREYGQSGDARRAEDHSRGLVSRSSRGFICRSSAFGPR